MERVLFLVSIPLLTSVVVAEPPVAYGPPGGFNTRNQNQDIMGLQGFRNSLKSNNFGSSSRVRNSNDLGRLGGEIAGPKIFRHISLFVAPQEPEAPRLRTIRTEQQADKHYQIIFIKAPSQSRAQQTEVQLSQAPETKTLVYVLLKKPEAGGNNVRIRGPAPTKPPAPEVFFIKYKDGSAAAAAGAVADQLGQIQSPSFSQSGGGAIPVRSSSLVSSLSSSYGVPSDK